jgi:hypothetical protein
MATMAIVLLGGWPVAQAQETQPEETPAPAPTQPNVNADRICLTEQDLPANTPHVILGAIDKSKVSYGSKDSLYPDMAEEAREMGANAVIQVDDFLAPSWFGWATPHLKGKAVKLDDPSILNSMNCQWF